MKLAIIGAGPAGLVVLRYAISDNFQCTVFEQSDKIGGLWNYTEYTDKDENGLPVHSSIYEGMKTNLPKETMEFEDFCYEECQESFLPHEKVLQYIQKFTKHFNLSHYVKFLNQVIVVEPVENEKWEVTVKNVKSGEIFKQTYDAIAVCSGRFFNPYLPKISGMEYFKDKSVHSHSYRKPDKYKNQIVLVIGAGSSGIDISRILLNYANKIVLSGKAVRKLSGVVNKPRVKYFTENGAVFEDTTEEKFDQIIYCTGYNTVYPFLSPKCGITVTGQNHVKPLYKHLVNIEHPTMAIINVTDKVTLFPLLAIEARFYLALLKCKFTKTKEEMYNDLLKYTEERRNKGFATEELHTLEADGMKTYCQDLASTAGIKNIPEVIYKIFKHYAVNGYEMVNYKILNEQEFTLKQNI